MPNSLLLQALQRKNRDRPPVWLMRQAGRYLPDYQTLRKRHSLRELFFTPKLAAEVTRMPVEQLGVDAAILFSDITVIALALGFKLDFNEGPILEPMLNGPSDVAKLVRLDVRSVLAPIGETVSLLKGDVPLIGFCGGPFTVASYLIEKHSGADLPKTKQWLYRDPASFCKLLDQIADASSEYLQMQVEQGAAAVQIFDSWAHVLSDEQFSQVCIPYWKRLLASVDVPGIVFARGNSFRVEAIEAALPAAISIDWQVPVNAIRKKSKAVLQGNLDPDLLFAPPEVVRDETKALLDSMRGDPAFIVNLGHGVKPGTPVEAVRSLIETVRNFKK